MTGEPGSRDPARLLRPERLGRSDARSMLAAAGALAATGSFVVELGALRDLDSTAIATLLELRRAHGERAQFRNPPPNLRKLAALYGVEDLIFASTTDDPIPH